MNCISRELLVIIISSSLLVITRSQGLLYRKVILLQASEENIRITNSLNVGIKWEILDKATSNMKIITLHSQRSNTRLYQARSSRNPSILAIINLSGSSVITQINACNIESIDTTCIGERRLILHLTIHLKDSLGIITIYRSNNIQI